MQEQVVLRTDGIILARWGTCRAADAVCPIAIIFLKSVITLSQLIKTSFLRE